MSPRQQCRKNCRVSIFFYFLFRLFPFRIQDDEAHESEMERMETLKETEEYGEREATVEKKVKLNNFSISFSFFSPTHRNAFGRNNSVYADSLLDKGFLLLNIDSIQKSVDAYQVNCMNLNSGKVVSLTLSLTIASFNSHCVSLA